MAGTLYAALVMHSYIMSLICCAVQVRAHLAGTPFQEESKKNACASRACGDLAVLSLRVHLQNV